MCWWNTRKTPDSLERRCSQIMEDPLPPYRLRPSMQSISMTSHLPPAQQTVIHMDPPPYRIAIESPPAL
jgi:hypothetical protein